MSFATPFVCIVGAPRSGTTWLQAMLGAHPAIATAQELKVFDLFTGPWEQAWRQLADLQTTAGGGPRGLRLVWSDDEFDGVLATILRDVYGRVLATKPGAAVVLDKSPGYSRYVTHIRRLIPRAKFIHVLRDGRDVAVSLRAAADGWARSWAPSAVDAAAKLWRSTVLAAREARQLGSEHYLELRYEDLVTDGPAQLRAAFAFVGVDTGAAETDALYREFTIDRMRESAGFPFDLPRAFFREGQTGAWRRVLTATERYLVDAAAGDLLRELGYAERAWWIERGYQRWLTPVVAGGRRLGRFVAARATARRESRP